MITKGKRLTVALAMLLVSALLLATASYAWFAMNTKVKANGVEVEAYSDSLFLQIKETGELNYDADGVVTFSDGNQALRLVTYGKIDGTSHPELYKLTSVNPAGDYALAGEKYYVPADSDAIVPDLDYEAPDVGATQDEEDLEDLAEQTRNDPKKRNFICVNAEIEKTTSSTSDLYKLSAIAEAFGVAVADTDYYTYDSDAGTYTKATVAVGEDVTGLYTLTAAVEPSGSLYDGSSTYYEFDDVNEVYTPKTGLELGTPVTGYYTLDISTLDSSVTTFSSGSYYYIKNGDDFSYLGNVSGAIADYLYWGRAYSTSLSQVQADNTLNIIGHEDDLANYRYFKSLTLTQGEGTTLAKNLRIAGVSVTGSTTSLDPALNILFVVKSEVNGVETKPRKFIVYDNGNPTAFNGSLYDTLLGDGEETVTVNMYVYFDGTDNIAKNDSATNLGGKNIQISFEIDNHDYNN